MKSLPQLHALQIGWSQPTATFACTEFSENDPDCLDSIVNMHDLRELVIDSKSPVGFISKKKPAHVINCLGHLQNLQILTLCYCYFIRTIALEFLPPDTLAQAIAHYEELIRMLAKKKRNVSLETIYRICSLLKTPKVRLVHHKQHPAHHQTNSPFPALRHIEVHPPLPELSNRG